MSSGYRPNINLNMGIEILCMRAVLLIFATDNRPTFKENGNCGDLLRIRVFLVISESFHNP